MLLMFVDVSVTLCILTGDMEVVTRQKDHVVKLPNVGVLWETPKSGPEWPLGVVADCRCATTYSWRMAPPPSYCVAGPSYCDLY